MPRKGKQRVRYLAMEKYAGLHILLAATRKTRPPSLPPQTRPSGVQTSLSQPRPPISLRRRRHRESGSRTDQRISTDRKVLWGISGVFLMGVVYSLWIGMQVSHCCR